MKKILITTLATIALAAPLAWAEPDDRRNPQQPEEQSVTGATPQSSEQAAPKRRTRSPNVSKFVTTDRAVEKDCEQNPCREPGKLQVEQRAPEHKCNTESCN